MELTLIISGGILLGCFIALSWLAGSDAPYIPTKKEDIKKILKLAGIKKGKKFYELGSGDGRVVIEAAKLKADAVGIEQSFLRILLSNFNRSISKVKKAKFYYGNIFSKNYSDGDIIYFYLLTKVAKRLEDKLKKELKKGSIVITNTYHFPTWRPFKKVGNYWFYRR